MILIKKFLIKDEDKMMFCDRCDRGFHTYCVGLGEVPSGSWLCTECSGWQDKLRGLSEKYNERTATTSPLKPPPLPSSPAAVAISPSVQLQLKSKINSGSSVKRLSSATSHVLLDDSISAKRGSFIHYIFPLLYYFISSVLSL